MTVKASITGRIPVDTAVVHNQTKSNTRGKMKIDREAIFDRQDGYCPWCDQHLGDNYAIHHRKLRKHGGTDSPENIIALHHGCHNLDTPSVHLSPAMGYDRGMIVHGWDDPIDVRLITKSGISVLLLTDGTQQKENQNEW